MPKVSARSKLRGAPWLGLAAVLLLLGALPAHAYLDPGTGSMLLQAAVALVAGAALALKTWWHKIRELFRKKHDDQ